MVQINKKASTVFGLVASAVALVGCDNAPLTCPFGNDGRTADSKPVGYTKSKFEFSKVVDGKRYTYTDTQFVTRWDKRKAIEDDWICNGNKPVDAKLDSTGRSVFWGL